MLQYKRIIKITVLSENSTRQIDCGAKDILLDVLRANGYVIAADCNGRGTCGKCTVTVRGGSFGKTEKTVLACKTAVSDGLEVIVKERRGGGLTKSAILTDCCDGESGFGLAVDIGTTTIAYALVGLSDGKILEKRAELNRQHTFGADVVSRIQSAADGNADTLSRLVREQIEENAARFIDKYDLPEIKKIFVCGNTTMLHLFCAESVVGLGQYPFRPVFTKLRRFSGRDLGLSANEITVLPSVGAFVGADVVAGVLVSGADQDDSLFIDIGTNGEMFINANGKRLCTSTAAGPCFEGANIECGMGGVDGAIDSFRRVNGKNFYTTIGNFPPRGLCGAGLADAIAAMLENGVIDETGAFECGERFVLTDGVFITQKDVRAFQLAKSAIFSGMTLLCDRAGRSINDLKSISIAGGLGYYLSGDSARKTGLLPNTNVAAQRVVGNAALAGTVRCMLSRAAVVRASEIAENTEYIDLSLDPDFADAYIENIGFRI